MRSVSVFTVPDFNRADKHWRYWRKHLHRGGAKQRPLTQLMQWTADNNKHVASCYSKQLNRSVYGKGSTKYLSAFFNKHCLQKNDHMQQGCQMRTKNNIHSNSVISNIYIIDEVFKDLIFTIRLSNCPSRSLAAAAATKCQYLTVQILRNLGACDTI